MSAKGTYKFRTFPWKQNLPTEYDEVEVKEPMDPKEKHAQAKAVAQKFVDLVLNYPGKKSDKSVAAEDDINAVMYDVDGCDGIEDQDWAQLKPDKKMFLIKTQDWANGMVKDWKKKGPADNITASVLAAMEAFVVRCEEGIKKKEAERQALKKLRKIVATFFDSLVAGDFATCDKMLEDKETAYLLDHKNRDKGFSTPVMVAVRAKNVKAVEWCISKKCDFTIEDSFKWTALNWAVDQGDEELQKILTEAGCKPGSGPQGSDDEDESDDEFNAYAAIAEA